MKLKRSILATVLVIGACSLFVSLIAAQRIIRIGGKSRARGNSAPTQETEKPAKDAVQPIDPSPAEAERIEDLIELLGDNRLVQRDRAMSELAGFEAKALGQVREGLKHDDDEIAARCGLLEEVIQSRNGELFLAARRLNLSINELNTHLNNEDVAPLLSILRSRAQAGLVPLWARVFARLAGRTQVFPSAELCIEIEGTTGYGQALARAARSPEAAPGAQNLMLLMALMSPGDPADTVETLTQLRFSIGEGRGIEAVLSSAADFRGVYTGAASLGASTGHPDPNVEDPEGADIVRAALAISITGTCTQDELNAAALPPLADMPPMLLTAWLALMQRSGLHAQIESAMLGMLSSDADTRRIGIAAGAYADTASVSDVIEVFDDLPYEAQLSVLDTWWLRPREPKLLQPFLIKLLGAEREGVRIEAAKALGQYHARSSVAALLEAANADTKIAPAALTSLIRMGDILTPVQLQSLADALPNANLLTRPPLVEILVRANHVDGLKPLRTEWRNNLPRNELHLAVQVLSLQPETAAGAYAIVKQDFEPFSHRKTEQRLARALDHADLEMIRALLNMSDAEGFALLSMIAQDENDSKRLAAMSALAMAGQDGDLVEDWLKRIAGEIKDPLASGIGAAVALSTTDAAEEFKRNALAQGIESINLRWTTTGVLAGRSLTVTREQLFEVLFDTPETAQQFAQAWPLISGPLSPKSARNLATALTFSERRNVYSQPGALLILADSGVDIIDILFGDATEPTPNVMQLHITALLGDPERAKKIAAGTKLREDGSNYVGLKIAKAWLGLLSGDENQRLKLGIASNPTNVFGAMWRMQQAKAGDAIALRTLLDSFGPHAIRFQRGATADVRLVNQRWGSPYMDTQGVANAAYMPTDTPPRLGGRQVGALFTTPPGEVWEDWWMARRALLEFDPDTAKFTFTELP